MERARSSAARVRPPAEAASHAGARESPGHRTPVARPRGFTLIEALAVLAAAALLLTLALPSFADLLRRQRVGTAMHVLGADLALARGTAVTRATQVVACPGDTGGCRDDGDWSAGWIVFLDGDRDRQPGGSADLLRVEERDRDALQIRSTRPFLRYQHDGRSAHANLTLHLCGEDRLLGQVVVNNTGRVRSARLDSATPCPAD